MVRLICILAIASCTQPAFADPITVSAVATGIGVGLQVAKYASIGAAIFTAFAVTAAVYIVGQANAPNDVRNEGTGRTRLIRQPITSRKIIYGQAKVSGPIIFWHSENDRIQHLVVVVAAHQVFSFDAFFVDDERVDLDAPDSTGMQNAATGSRYRDHLHVQFFHGTDDQSALTGLRAALPTQWTENHRLRGCAGFYARLGSADVYPNGVPNLSVVVKGKMIADPRSPRNPPGWTDNAALCARDYLLDADLGLGVSPSEIHEPSWIAGANLADEIVPFLEDQSTLQNRATGTDVSQKNLTINADGQVVNTGDQVFVSSISDPRYMGDILEPASFFAISDGAGGFRPASSLANARAGIIDDFHLDIPANITSDNTSGTASYRSIYELRYTINGVVDTSTRPEDNVRSMLAAQGAEMCYSNGQFRLIDESIPAPSMALTDDVILNIAVSPRTSKIDYFNSAKGVIVMPQESWQPVEYPPVTEANSGEYGGKEIYRDIGLSFTISPEMARRVARVHIRNARNQVNVVVDTNLSALRTQVGDTVTLTLDRYGFNAKLFRVVGFEINPGSDAMTCKLQLRESRVPRFTTESLSGYVLSPATDLPNAFTSNGPPRSLTLESGNDELSVGGDGTVVVGIRATWTAPTTGFADRYELEHRITGTTHWTSVLIPGSATEHLIEGISDGRIYDVRIRAITALGVRSDYASVNAYTVIGKRERPPIVGSFTVSTLINGTRQFRFATDYWPSDVRVGGGIQFRYRAGTAGFNDDDWDRMTILRDTFRASPYETNELPEGPYLFAAKLFDSSNNESQTARFVRATLGPQNLGTTLFSRDEESLQWPGTLGSMTIRRGTGLVTSAGTTNWRELSPSPDQWRTARAQWRESSSGNVEYTSPVVDLAASLFFTPRITLTTRGGTPAITFRYGMTLSGGAIVNPQTQTLTSGTTGTPISARYIQIIVAVPPTTTVGAAMERMNTILSGDNVEYDYNAINTASSTVPGFTRIGVGHFRVQHLGGASSIIRASITPHQGSATGLRGELVSRNTQTSGPPVATFKVYNSSGVLTDAVVDILLTGPRSGGTT